MRYLLLLRILYFRIFLLSSVCEAKKRAQTILLPAAESSPASTATRTTNFLQSLKNTHTLNDNLKELQVIESKRYAIRKGLVYELLNAQNTVLCLYFAQRSRERNEWQNLTKPRRCCGGSIPRAVQF